MKVAFITNSMAPYRTKQFEEIVKINHWLLASYADMEAYDLESDIDMRLNEGGFKEYEWK